MWYLKYEEIQLYSSSPSSSCSLLLNCDISTNILPGKSCSSAASSSTVHRISSQSTPTPICVFHAQTMYSLSPDFPWLALYKHVKLLVNSFFGDNEQISYLVGHCKAAPKSQHFSDHGQLIHISISTLLHYWSPLGITYEAT